MDDSPGAGATPVTDAVTRDDLAWDGRFGLPIWGAGRT